MSKKIKIATIFLIVIICIIGVIKFTNTDAYLRWYLTPYLEKKLEGFDEHKSDYQLIVDKLIKLRDEGKEVKDDDYLEIEEDTIYSFIVSRDIVLTNEEKNSLLNIKKTFVGEFCVMDKVKTSANNYVKFASSQCPFSVVYSEDGSKPESRVEYDTYTLEYDVKMIAPKWYTVEEK